MKTAVSLFVALTLFGLVMGLDACEVVEVAPLTAPLTCDGELVTERFVVSMDPLREESFDCAPR